MVTQSQTFTVPPLDMVMPHPGEEITFAIFSGGAVLLAIYGVILAVRERSWLPIILLTGAQLSFLLEGPADVMGNALYPPIGQNNVHSVKGHTIPWFVVPVYVWYIGMLPLLMYRAFVTQQISRKTWWIIAGTSFVGVAAIEQIPVYFGLWTYYGVQPLKIGLMPLWLIAANTACVMVPTTLIYRMIPRFSGWRQLLFIPLVPAGCAMGHAGSGIVMYNVLGGSTETMPMWILYAGSVATVVLALVIIQMFIEWACEPQPKRAH